MSETQETMVQEMKDNLDEAVRNMTKTIKQNTPAYGEAPSSLLEPNIVSLEKLLILRGAVEHLYKVSNPDENSEAENHEHPLLDPEGLG